MTSQRKEDLREENERLKSECQKAYGMFKESHDRIKQERDAAIQRGCELAEENTAIKIKLDAALSDLKKAMEALQVVADWKFDIMGDCVADARIVATTALAALRGKEEKK